MATTKTHPMGIVTIGVVLATVGAWSFQQDRAAFRDKPDVTRADVERWKQNLTNWGRWGPDDEIGTLNLITSEKRKHAAALVQDGISVSLARDAETEEAIDNPRPYRVIPLGITADEIRVSYHGFIHTHLDFLNHNFIGDGVTYNGYTPDPTVVAEEGSHSRNTVRNAKHGIVTRGILIDMPRFKNVPYLEPGTPIYIEDLEAWEAETGLTVSPGDAVFIRTGRWTRRAAVGLWDVNNERAGLDPSVIPWLKERDVAILGSDSMHDAMPLPDGDEIDSPFALHDFVLIMLGVHLFDNVNLEEVGDAAAERSRWEFLLTAAPLRFRTATGSPLNPIAVF